MKGREVPSVYEHVLFKCIVKPGRCAFAVDLSSAQYGFHVPVVPWGEYFATRAVSGAPCTSYEPLGSTRMAIKSSILIATDVSRALFRLADSAVRMLKDELVHWEKASGMTIRQLLKADEKTWEKGKKGILEHVDTALREWLSKLKEDSIH